VAVAVECITQVLLDTTLLAREGLVVVVLALGRLLFIPERQRFSIKVLLAAMVTQRLVQVVVVVAAVAQPQLVVLVLRRLEASVVLALHQR